MRELKFRAWDKIHEKYREPMVYDIFHEKIVVRFPIETLKKGEFLLEQYTGLKDKNGKEIYEGDIVENTYEYVGKVRYEVRWECGRFIMESRKPANLVQIGMGIYPHSSEVIGNIHENPELLREEEE